MARIVPGLLRSYQSRIINPSIVEFDTISHATDILPTLGDMASSTYLSSFSGPIDFMSLRPQIRGNFPPSRSQVGAGASRSHFFDRIASRFQNTILSLKLLSRMKMIAAPLSPDSIDEVAGWPEVTTVYEDKLQTIFQIVPPDQVFTSKTGKRFTTTYYTKKLIGADVANSEGYRGQGVTVAVPDTGGAPTHEQNFGMQFHSTMREKGQFKDTNGHGEWCVSCIGGKHVDERTFDVPVEGMAPEVSLIGIKCLGFVMGIGFQSDIIEAIEYSIEQNADIVSMSLGSDSMPDNPDDDPEIKAVNEMVSHDIIPVIAAGNAGPDAKTIGTPGCAPNALTVAASDPIKGGIASFSSRGPTKWGEVKPDVIAPGADIYSGCIGLLDMVGDNVPNRYSILSGTSMATPHVAGLLACAREFYATLGQVLTVDMVKTICQRYGNSKNTDVGWGYINWDWFKRYAADQGWV